MARNVAPAMHLRRQVPGVGSLVVLNLLPNFPVAFRNVQLTKSTWQVGERATRGSHKHSSGGVPIMGPKRDTHPDKQVSDVQLATTSFALSEVLLPAWLPYFRKCVSIAVPDHYFL